MVNVRIVTIGKIQSFIKLKTIWKWKSEIFSVIPEELEYPIPSNADTASWGYSDLNLQQNLPDDSMIKNVSIVPSQPDFVLYITNVPLEQNYFSRILGPNQVVITTYEIKDILENENIPIENYVISLLYTYSLMYISYKKLSMKLEEKIAHDETRGCLFDMCGIKEDVVHTCIMPGLCGQCKAFFQQKYIPEKTIHIVESELKRLNRSLYNRMVNYMKSHPILTLCISGGVAIILNLISSVIFSGLCELYWRLKS